MPELPEVERAASLAREIAQGRVIERVETVEDNLVYSGITHEEFAKAIIGRRVIDVGRYGKVFYITLDGKGPSPVLHFGMTGMLQVKGQEPTYYRRKPCAGTPEWPPRYMKFILHIAASTTSPATQLAFLDPRRLGRIRLCASPMTEPPISNLGFDPLLTMPSLEDYATLVRKRTCVIKALLLDQSFNAGIGNWVADEILYQARVHPEERANGLTGTQLMNIHKKTVEVCRKAVDVNADSSGFPQDWLFNHRWENGKKVQSTLRLPNGNAATIKWIKVGGRTSAYVAELQFMSKNHDNASPRDEKELDEDSRTLSDGQSAGPTMAKRKGSESDEDNQKPGSRMSKRVRTSMQAETERLDMV